MNVKFQGNKLTLEGKTLKVGDKLESSKLVTNDLQDTCTCEMKGLKIFLTVPSLDTPVCDTEVKKFNQEAASYKNVSNIYCVSMDLPFAQSRWCQNGLVSKVITLSDYKFHEFSKNTGTYIKELGLLTRAVFIVNEENKVIYVDYLEEITNEPDYNKVINFLKQL